MRIDPDKPLRCIALNPSRMNTQRYLNAAHELKDLLHTALRNSSHFAGGNVRIEVADREIILSGIVRSYYQKQVVQESLRPLIGTARIQNNLDVVAL